MGSWCVKTHTPGACGHSNRIINPHYCFINFLTIVIIFCANFTILLASQSGIYVDNGVDQTIMHRVLDDADRVIVEQEILEFLGLPERPSMKHGHQSLRKSAPQFLLDVYNRLNEQENNDGSLKRSKRDVRKDDNFITEIDKQGIDQSDIIMTFLSKNHHVSEVRHERGRRLWFDVSGVSDDNYLMIGELRLYQKPSEGNVAKSGKNFTISVYAIVQFNGEQELELLSSVNTTSDYEGWLELNVTEGIVRWMSDLSSNKGVYIAAHDIERPEHEVKLDNIGLVHQQEEEEYQPFMIGFFQGPDLIKRATRNHSRRKRETSRTKWNKKSDMYNPLLDPHHGDGIKSCHIQTLYIAFQDIQWQDWIIQPVGYGAYYCGGECNFPMNAHMNATNHAIVQTLVHLLEPRKVPKPCCVPTKLVPLSVLYFKDDGSVNLHTYKNMIVKSCGCH